MSILKIYWRTVLLFIIITFLSLINVSRIASGEIQLHKHFDKFAHFIMYLSLSFIFYIENFKSIKPLRKRWIVLDTIVLGIALEFTQALFTNNRSGNFYDAIFNTIGVVTGSILFFSLRKYNIIYKLLLFKNIYSK